MGGIAWHHAEPGLASLSGSVYELACGESQLVLVFYAAMALLFGITLVIDYRLCEIRGSIADRNGTGQRPGAQVRSLSDLTDAC
jgi:hypothetical protein